MKAKSYQKDLIAARTQGCVLVPNAISTRDPIDISRVEMGPNMRKGFLPLGTMLCTKCHRNADILGKQSVSVVFTENRIFLCYFRSSAYLLTL